MVFFDYDHIESFFIRDRPGHLDEIVLKKKPKINEIATQNSDWYSAGLNSILWFCLLKYARSNIRKATMTKPNRISKLVWASMYVWIMDVIRDSKKTGKSRF